MMHSTYLANLKDIPEKPKYHYESGFTLIELMIAIVLGLLIVAAAFQILYVSQRTSTTQKSATSVQDANVFGLDRFQRHVRLANLGFSPILNGKSVIGGVILTDQNAPTAMHTKPALYSRSGSGPSHFGTDNPSDQLTIQFVIPDDMVDCEGASVNTIKPPMPPTPVRLIQRYYLQQNGEQLDLMCDADSSGTGADLGKGEVILIPNVDQFRVQLLTSSGQEEIGKYVENISKSTPIITNIYGVRVSLVIAGQTPTMQAKGADTYTIFGKDYKIDSGINTIRKVYEPNILFRNARG